MPQRGIDAHGPGERKKKNRNDQRAGKSEEQKWKMSRNTGSAEKTEKQKEKRIKDKG